VFGYRVAMLVSSAGALYLAEFFGWQVTYLVMAALVLVGVVTVLANPEPAQARSADLDGRERRMADWRAARPHLAPAAADVLGFLYVAVLAPFAEFMGRRGWIGVLLFVVFYKFGDSLAGVMTTPFLLKIGFSKPEIANVVKLYGFVATFVGLALGGWLMNAAGMIRSLWIAGILQLASNFMFAVQALAGHDIGLLALTISFENLAGGMGTAVFVAYLSALCNRAYTATQYALVSSFMATARTWLVSSAGFMADELGWFWFFAATAGAALPGLILLWWLARRGFGAPERMANQAT